VLTSYLDGHVKFLNNQYYYLINKYEFYGKASRVIKLVENKHTKKAVLEYASLVKSYNRLMRHSPYHERKIFYNYLKDVKTIVRENMTENYVKGMF
jgi:hypothetical protein